MVVVLTLLELNWEMGNKSYFWSILEGGRWVTSRGYYWCPLKIPKKGGKLHETVANCIVIIRGKRYAFSDTLAWQAHVQLSIT